MYETIIIAITLSPKKEVEITRLGPGIELNPLKEGGSNLCLSLDGH
jgi:hypothetical protein